MNENLILILKNYLRLLDNSIDTTKKLIPNDLIKKEKTILNEEIQIVDCLKPIYDFRASIFEDISLIEKWKINH